MQINPNLKGQLPRVAPPIPFHDPVSQLRGWKLAIPGGRPLATPAVVDGVIFLGGGFGSYDFYALDAQTGAPAWQYQTNDDGPTAAVVAEGYVAFNTESCELEILTVAGRPVWKKWLGDPLMSMPAIERGKVYMVYPESRGDHRHYLACFELTTGREVWRQPIPGEIVTAPVLAAGKVYITNLDGSLGCFAQADGQREWHEPRQATSSPVVWENQCYFSQRHEVSLKEASGEVVQQMEYMATKLSAAGTESIPFAGVGGHADYLDHAKRLRGSPMYRDSAGRDATVGFGSHKGDAKMEQAQRHLGHGHVSSLWSYQGSKPFLSRGRLYSAHGDTVHCADPRSGEVYWKQRLSDSRATEVLDSVLTPPAVVNGKLFFGSIEGHVYCLTAETGALRWRCTVGEPVLFQPAVVKGRVYVPTHAGSLFCLETGDEADDGWMMWGADARHNGLPE